MCSSKSSAIHILQFVIYLPTAGEGNVFTHDSLSTGGGGEGVAAPAYVGGGLCRGVSVQRLGA